KIALVEDDPLQRKAVSSWLNEAGHQCQSFADGHAFLKHSHEHNSYQLLLLDWELPDQSGLELLRRLRQEMGLDLPVMFLTCRAAEDDIVSALQNGADDYLVKPARHRELLARIDALARRHAAAVTANTDLQIGPFELDLHSRQLRKNGQPLSLTQKEFSLAHYLLSNQGHLITRQELLEQVWQQSATINTRTVDTHISRLRKKLELFPEQGWHLSAVYQYGYRLDWLEGESTPSAL
ncbi:MAG: response regulator transcription factor, partial [Gammaproteobacteria bacterium]|nr:response regulator transcription factor [Gammaproteobacteria bacterium]